MKYRTLPGTELDLSEVGFGVWTVSTGRAGEMYDGDRVRLLELAFDTGITFFNTADAYGNGYGEEILFKALRRQRHDVIIGTKFGYDFYNLTPRMDHDESPQRFDSPFIRYACEQSLRRLGTEYIDLYQIHNPTVNAIDQDELFETLDDLKTEGKIRYYGVALGGGFEEGEAAMRKRSVRSLEIIYSIIEQDIALKLGPVASEEGIGLICRSPYAYEILTGQYDYAATMGFHHKIPNHQQQWLRTAREKVGMLGFLAMDTGRTLAQAAIKFCLNHGSMVSVLPNIRNVQELEEYSGVSETSALSSEENAFIEEFWEKDFRVS